MLKKYGWSWKWKENTNQKRILRWNHQQCYMPRYRCSVWCFENQISGKYNAHYFSRTKSIVAVIKFHIKDIQVQLLTNRESGPIYCLIVKPNYYSVKYDFQLQSSQSNSRVWYSSIYHGARRILRDEGIRAFWKGHIPSQCLSMIYSSVQVSTPSLNRVTTGLEKPAEPGSVLE